MRVATVDIGTNSVLLLIADSDPHQPQDLRCVHEASTITRLGQDVDRTGRLSEDAVRRTLACLSDYGEVVRAHQVERLEVVSTSAARDATGTEAFLAEAERVLTVRPRVISGEEEAELAFRGALTGLGIDGRVVVYDVGGGSTEVVFGSRRPGSLPKVERASSLDIGCVRLTERHVRSDPPRSSELDAVREDTASALVRLPKPTDDCSFIGIGGTITTLVAIEKQLDPYDSSLVHGSKITSDAVIRLGKRLGGVDLAQRQSVRGLAPKRADVIVAGAVLVHTLLTWACRDATLVSDRGVRWGLALKLVGPTV